MLSNNSNFVPSINFAKKTNYKSFSIDASQLLPLLEKLAPKRPMLIDIRGIDNHDQPTAKFRLTPIYSIYCFESDLFIEIEVNYIEGKTELPSISSIFPVAAWSERELAEMFGFKFENRVFKRLFTSSGVEGHPLLKDFDASKVKFNDQDFNEMVAWEPTESVCASDRADIGYQTFLTAHGELGLSIQLESNIIKEIDPRLGFQHRSIEKLFEGLNYQQILSVIGFVNPNYKMMMEVVWAMSVEEMLNIKLTDYAQAIRVIFMELTRMKGHLINLKEISVNVGGGKQEQIFMEMLYEINSFLEFYGDRVTIIGGVKDEIAKGWRIECLRILNRFTLLLDKAFSFYGNSCVMKSRMQLGTVQKEMALSYSSTGPTLRASGVNFDLRKRSPFYFYSDLDFDVALGMKGQVFDRFMVMLEEIKQSVRMIEQVVDGIPVGKAHCWSAKGNLSNNYELIEHFNHYSGKFSGKKESVTTFIESGNGILGVSLIPGEENQPYRVKLRTPSFSHFQLFEEIVKGEDYGDLALIMSSMGINIGEIDR